jgi:uncharacterized protein (TIGR03545 family)
LSSSTVLSKQSSGKQCKQHQSTSGITAMTNSTINNKVVKPKGPIRTEAVLPISIIFIAVFLYFHFFFDHNLRKAMEWTGVKVYGAEVNVGSVHTSFFGGSFILSNLQITNKENPSQNLLQIGEIRFKFLWDALLRAKFVVADAGIDQIQLYSTRKSPGFIVPPEPPSNAPSALSKIENNVLNQTKNEFSGNAIGDLAALLEGSDSKDMLKNIQGSLKSEATINALTADLKVKEKEWKERINKMPNKAEFDELSKRAKALKFNSKDPKQFAADIKEAGKIAKEADQKIDFVKELSASLKTDVDKYNKEFGKLDDLIKQDTQDLENRLKIPQLDMKDFSKNLFGNMFAAKLGSMQKYMELGRKYMPPPKDPNAKKEEELIPPARGKGKNYHFPVTTGYPVFWLKKATISSTPTSDGFSGQVAGELTNVTTDPHFVGKPIILDVKGDFPNSQVYNTQLKVILDHVNTPKESLNLNVGTFPVSQLQLVSSSSVGLGVKTAKGTSQLSAIFDMQNLDVDMKNSFNTVDYDITAKSNVVKEAVTTILGGIPSITLNAKANGHWDNINFDLNSNLGAELSAGFSKFVKAKIEEKRQQIRALIDARIKGPKDKLTGDFNKLKGQVDSNLNEKKAEVDKAKNDVKSDTNGKDSPKENAKKSLQEKGKKLLKGFKF